MEVFSASSLVGQVVQARAGLRWLILHPTPTPKLLCGLLHLRLERKQISQQKILGVNISQPGSQVGKKPSLRPQRLKGAFCCYSISPRKPIPITSRYHQPFVQPAIAMTDRRRINGPPGETIPPFFDDADRTPETAKSRSRPPNSIRKMCMLPRLMGCWNFADVRSSENWNHTVSIRFSLPGSIDICEPGSVRT